MSVPSSEAAAKPRQRSFWIAVICGAVILTIGIGARQSFGIFQKPIAADLHVGRERNGAIAISTGSGDFPVVGANRAVTMAGNADDKIASRIVLRPVA